MTAHLHANTLTRTAPSAPPARFASTLDVAGAASAVMCAAHCIATGMFVAVLPLIGAGALLSERIEHGFAAAAVVLGVLSVGIGRRAHGQPTPALLLIAGLGLLLAIRPLADEGSWVEMLFVVVGATLLVSAHWRNLRAGRSTMRSRNACTLLGELAVPPSPDVVASHPRGRHR